MNDFERELALESEMLKLGDSRMWANVLQARDQEQESRTKYAHRIMTGDGRNPGALEAFTVAVDKFLKEAKGKPGRKHSLVPVLEQFDDPAIVAFITLQVCLNCITAQRDLTLTAYYVGLALEDELRFKRFEEVNKPFWNTLIKDLQKREHNLERRRAIIIHEMMKGAKRQKGLRWASWSKEEQVCIGLRVIEILEQSTGLVQTFTVREKRHKTVGKISATMDTLVWINKFMENGGVLAPVYMPMVIPPRRWKSPVGGGYWLKTMNQLKLVKVYGDRGREYLQGLGRIPGQLQGVYAALNAVQSTPWKINVPVLEVMQQASKAGLEIGKAPMMVPAKDKAELEAKLPLPVKPVDIETNEAARRTWCRDAAKVYTARVKQVSKSLQHNQLLWLADKYKGEATIYFPMQLDFRGRMYAVPSILNPQGADPAKGLLTFAKGKKLGAEGLRWLLIHAANMYGFDKVSLDAREMWSLEKMTMIEQSAADPFTNREWMKADKPWQFLAACIEINEAYKLAEPTEYFSHLPVTVDGTCNGLQHFSAMLLDEDGAEAVNLKPNEVPQDIYQRVADRVRDRFEKRVLLEKCGLSPEAQIEMQQAWLKWGFDRKSTKRAVMIVPYSGTMFAAKKYTIDYIQERKDCPFADPFLPAYFFAQHVWISISEVIVSAKQAMDWLRKIGNVVATHGNAAEWTTPIGFPVRQDYRDLTQYQVNTKLGQSIRFQPVLLRETDRFDVRWMEQGISPNFVHSLDAACLMLTVNRSIDEGIDSFAMVHDSYGVLAGDMDQLYVGLRQAFVDIYQHDVMGDFFSSTTTGLSEEELRKIPARPVKGTFVLESVKESKYFFA